MYSDEECNSSEELQPRTNLRPTPAPFSHAPFKSVVPDVSLVLNSTKNQAIVDTPQTEQTPSSEHFESYNAWRHNNLKSSDESSPRFKYYTTSPRYTNGVIPAKTSVGQQENGPQMSSQQPMTYELSRDNLQWDSRQLLKSDPPADRRYVSPAINQEMRQDFNNAQAQYDPKYQSAKTLPETYLRSPTNFPSSNCRGSNPSQQPYEHLYQQSPQPFQCFQQNLSHQNCLQSHPMQLPGNCVQSQLRNTNLNDAPHSLFNRENLIGPEMPPSNRNLYCNEIYTRQIPNNSLTSNARVQGSERFNSDSTNHRGEGDCFAGIVQTDKRPDHQVSVADLYRLIQMQNEEIRGLKAQVQGLLNQNNCRDVREITHTIQGQGLGLNSNCQTGHGRQDEQQLSRSTRNGGRENVRDNAVPNLLNGQNGGRHSQHVNECDDTRMCGRNEIDNDKQTKNMWAPQDWDENTNHASTKEWTQRNVSNQQNGAANEGVASASNTDTNRPMRSQHQTMVQQVSIGVMTSFVDQNVFYQRPVERRAPKPNALLRQATAGNGASSLVADRGSDGETCMKRTNPLRGNTQCNCQDRKTGGSHLDDDDSMTLGGVTMPTAREPEHSPNASVHVDVLNFRSGSSSSSSAEEDPPRVGWTFYHNMVGQVNDMLHTGPDEGQDMFESLNQSDSARPRSVGDDDRTDQDLELKEHYDAMRPNAGRGNTRMNGNQVRNDRHENRYENGRDNGRHTYGRNVDENQRNYRHVSGREADEDRYREQAEVVDRGGMLYGRKKACDEWVSSEREVPTLDSGLVRVATMQQLRRLGVSTCETDSVLAASKKVTFDSVYYLPREAGFGGHNNHGPSDVSMRMDALAMKYLQGDRLEEYARLPGGGGQERRIYDLTGKVCNVSMATMRYLERYQLVPGTAQSKTQAAPFVEQPAPFPRQERMRNNFRPAVNEQHTIPPHKILDITALKEQPKFI